MKIKKVKNIHKKQPGFTLIELLVALTIVAFVLAAASAGLYQMIARPAPASNGLQAINNVQNAGERISRDAANAEEVDFSSGYPVFTWHDYGYTDDAHKTTITYYVSPDGSLMRTVQYGIITGILPVNAINTGNVYLQKGGVTNIFLTVNPVSFVISTIVQPKDDEGSLEIPQIQTDKTDYAPGETVKVVGTGFWPKERIQLAAVGSPNGLQCNGSGMTDLKGSFVAFFKLPELEDGTYLLTAIGCKSGLMAQSSFRDARSAASVTVGSQNGSLTSGVAGSVTFTITVGSSGSGNGSSNLTVTGLPTGATGSFSPAAVNFSNQTPSPTSTFSITTNSVVEAGSYPFTVRASGGTNPTGNGTLTIGTGLGTTTSVSSSHNPSAFGQSVTFTATVTGTSGTPTGTVSFLDGGNPIGTGALNGLGIATCTTSNLTVGNHSITAAYSGHSSFNPSTSSTITQTIFNVLNTTTTSLSSSFNPSAEGQSVTFIAVVSSSAGTPSGEVQFTIDGSNFGSPVMLFGGGATSNTMSSFTIGTHTVTASYIGDTNYSTSTGTLTQTVNDSSVPTPTPLINTSLVARNILISNITPPDSDGVFGLTIISTVGSGSNQRTETRTYQLTMRNHTPTP